MNILEDLLSQARRHDAVLTMYLHGLLALCSPAIDRRAAVVPQEVHQLVDVRRC